MQTNCRVCGLKFELEDGFWTSALWVSYPFVLLLSVTLLLAGIFVFKQSVILSAVITTAILGLLLVPIIRYARVLLLHFSVRYQPR